MQSETSPRRQRSFIEEARRAQIIAAAEETVAEVGYAGASLARIAKQAGTSKSVISYYFAGKEELLAQVVSQFFAETEDYMRGQLVGESAATGRLQAWVGAQMRFFGQHRTRFLATSEIAVNHRAADGSRPFIDATREEHAVIAGILAAGQRSGEFRDFDPAPVATIISQCIEGVLSAWMADERIDLETQTGHLIDFIDHAIRGDAR